VEQEVEQVRTIIGTMREHNEQCLALVRDSSILKDMMNVKSAIVNLG